MNALWLLLFASIMVEFTYSFVDGFGQLTKPLYSTLLFLSGEEGSKRNQIRGQVVSDNNYISVTNPSLFCGNVFMYLLLFSLSSFSSIYTSSSHRYAGSPMFVLVSWHMQPGCITILVQLLEHSNFARPWNYHWENKKTKQKTKKTNIPNQLSPTHKNNLEHQHLNPWGMSNGHRPEGIHNSTFIYSSNVRLSELCLPRLTAYFLLHPPARNSIYGSRRASRIALRSYRFCNDIMHL